MQCLHMLSIGNRCLTPGYEREREIGFVLELFCRDFAAHCSMARHPVGYTDNKAAVRFGHFQS